jgi:hydrogenase/urease accessory protein HupE
MATNLPSYLAQLRLWIVVLFCLLTAVSAQAHPGHEGGHDGDEFVWTYEHAARHPWATLLCLAAGMALAWLVVRALRRARQPFKAGVTRNRAAGMTS